MIVIDKLKKIYAKGDIFRAYIDEKEILPIEIALKKVTQKDIQQGFSATLQESKKLKELKLPLIYKEHNFKTLGKQVLPVAVRFDNLEMYLNFIDKRVEYKRFVLDYENITTLYPALKDIFFKKPFLVLEYSDRWDRVLKIVDFLMKNRHPDIYIRELCIERVDTKFVEKHKKVLDLLLSNLLHVEPLNSISDFAFEKKYGFKHPLSQVRFRVLDEELYILGLSDLTLTCREFEKLRLECKRVFIVENKITFLSFFDIKNSIVIFGSGYGVSVLKNATWLKDKELFYWGDIDEDGFAILSQIRGYFSHVKSIFMDEKTIDGFKELKVEHALKQKNMEIKNLTEEEMLVYRRLQNDFYGKNFRLEQEKIPFDYIYYNLERKWF